ncbi:MAG: MGMT family protein [Chloroflexota bacterium]
MEHLPLGKQQTYYEAVWELVRQVPYSSVVTYGQVAQLIDRPAGVDAVIYKAFGPRWVGEAMAACPSDVPWQRVINAQGKISQRPGSTQQRAMLETEGIPFVNDKIDLKVYQWRGPGAGPPPRQASLF